MSNTSSRRSRLPPLTVQILIGMVLGAVLGLWRGIDLSSFGLLGTLLIQLIKAIAVPLVLASIIEALLSTRIAWTGARRLLLIILINTTCAATIAITLSNVIAPGTGVELHPKSVALEGKAVPKAPEEMGPLEIVVSHVPSSILQPFNDNDIIGVVLIALLIGIAARQVTSGDTELSKLQPALIQWTQFFVRLFERILSWLVRLTPLAVFGVTAKTVGEHGLAPFHALSLLVVTVFTGFAIQALVVYQIWIKVVARRSLLGFWREVRLALVYAFGTNSSLATLPLTLASLDRIGVSKGSSRLGACIGTNLNNDGILLYEGIAVLFVAQAYGMDLTLAQQLSALFVCIFAAMGVAGIPEAGIISLSLVLGAANLPMEILPLLLTVDWVIARGRSVANVLADFTVSIALDGCARKEGY